MNSKLNLNETNNFEILAHKSWLIVDSSGNIKFSNETFKHLFLLEDDKNIKQLNFEPNIHGIISKLAEKDINSFDNIFIYEENNKIYNYKIEIEKILLLNSNFYILVFSRLDEQNNIEDKISNLHFALEYGKVPVMIFDNNGMISFATNTFERILDFELDEIYNNHISTILSKHLSHEKLQKLEESIKNGRQWNETVSLSLVNETKFYFELKLNPILNESGSILNFVLTAHDITYYISKNELTQKSENRLKSIINNISDLLIILKQSNDFIYFENGNNTFLKTFNLEKESILHKIFEDVIPGKLASKIKSEITLLKKNEELSCKFNFDIDDRAYAGRIIIIEDVDSNENLYVISLKDITDERDKRKQLNELYRKELQVNRLKTTFLQNMSHEIRTPFTAIMGYSDIMVESIEEKDYDTVIEITDSLKSVLNRVMNLFESILEVSEIQSGEVVLENVLMNCNQILKSVCAKKNPEAKLKGIEIELDLDSQDYLCEIDWLKFERLILNLVDNAIKYTDFGKIKVSSRKTKEYVTITISDTGLGINETVISQLLKPFIQEELDGHSRNYEGAGLGLTIAYEYTKLMNGEMHIKSKKNVGTEIFLNFPTQFDTIN
ncbi:MAG: PAS domain-containing sensor histidine kinase [Bacteroidetes bacterium]|nr:PAS domain-containing sensor histidine kinase [Bacteroidota bacterium]MBU1115138.1 PAS domain-containing sensor histidine kinase [Bacteroidota bacterium]MBU1799277.1 PAS domain-containing sensor histidine kinase [Bacteroidota bacterium]